ESYVPDRDIILALTAGEEGGMPYNGVDWLLKNKKSLIDAEYTINVDAGGGELENGKHTLFDVQAAEKVFHSVSLTVRNPGGHSSLPRKDNAIYTLARALQRLEKFEFQRSRTMWSRRTSRKRRARLGRPSPRTCGRSPTAPPTRPRSRG